MKSAMVPATGTFCALTKYGGARAADVPSNCCEKTVLCQWQMPGGTSMLEKLQQQLHDTYQTDHDYDVRDFLITDPKMASVIGGDSVLSNNGESLFLCEDDDGLAMSLYLEKEILGRLEEAGPIAAGQLDDLCKVIEGVSHFNYVIWRAARDRCDAARAGDSGRGRQVCQHDAAGE